MCSSIPTVLEELQQFGVRNCREIESCLLHIACLALSQEECLRAHRPEAEAGEARAAEKVSIPAGSVEVQDFVDFISAEKKILTPIEADVKDAKRRISNVKPRKGRNSVKEESFSDDGGSDAA